MPAMSTIWAFDLGKGSIGEAVWNLSLSKQQASVNELRDFMPLAYKQEKGRSFERPSACETQSGSHPRSFDLCALLSTRYWGWF